MIKGVVCLNPSDACKYLADSYRPLQDRNNKLAATYDGAHGQAAQARVGIAAFYNATAENASPLAVAGRFVAGQRGAGAGQLCEAAVRAYGAAMGSVCTCSRCKEWDLQQDPVRAVHNFYSDTNPGVSEACDTNKTTPSCVCQPGSKNLRAHALTNHVLNLLYVCIESALCSSLSGCLKA